MKPDEAAKEARRKLREKKYSSTQAMLMIHTALIIKDSANPTLSDEQIVEETIKLTDLAIDAGQRASKS